MNRLSSTAVALAGHGESCSSPPAWIDSRHGTATFAELVLDEAAGRQPRVVAPSEVAMRARSNFITMHSRKRRASSSLEHPGYRRSSACLESCENNSPQDLLGLGIDVLSLIVRRLPVQGVVQLEATCKYFQELCASESLWRYLCLCDFGLVTRGRCPSYRKLYELFHKAHAIVHFKNLDRELFFCDVRLHKESDAIWFMVGSTAPPSCPLAKWKTIPASKVRHFGISRKEMQEHFRGQMVPAAHAHGGRPFKHYTWQDVYKVALTVHGGQAKLQSYIIRRCLDTRISNSVEERFERLRYLRRRRQLDRFIKNLSQHERCLGVLSPRLGNTALTSSGGVLSADMHFSSWHQVVDSLVRQHLVFRLFLDGKLRKGMATLQVFVTFCRCLHGWLRKRSRLIHRGSYTGRDYCMCLDIIEDDLSEHLCEGSATVDGLLKRAKLFYSRVKNIWRWQLERGIAHCRDRRPSEIVSSHPAFKAYVHHGNEHDFHHLKTHFTSQEVLVRFLDSNSWTREVLPLCELQPFYWAMGLVPPLDQSSMPEIGGSSAKIGGIAGAVHAGLASAMSSPWWPSGTADSGILERLLLGRQVYEQKEQLMSTFTLVQRTIWEHVEQYLLTGSEKDLLRVLRLLHTRGKHQMKAFAERHAKNLTGLEGIMQRLQSEVEVVRDLSDNSSDMDSAYGDDIVGTVRQQHYFPACTDLSGTILVLTGTLQNAVDQNVC